jgi:hypothetical protein
LNFLVQARNEIYGRREVFEAHYPTIKSNYLTERNEFGTETNYLDCANVFENEISLHSSLYMQHLSRT